MGNVVLHGLGFRVILGTHQKDGGGQRSPPRLRLAGAASGGLKLLEDIGLSTLLDAVVLEHAAKFLAVGERRRAYADGDEREKHDEHTAHTAH